MRFVPAGTSIAFPSITSLGMAPAPRRLSVGGRPREAACRGARPDVARPVADVVVELGPELLHVGDVRPDGPVVEGADRRSRTASGHVEDRVGVGGHTLAGEDAPADLEDPARALPAGRALAAR